MNGDIMFLIFLSLIALLVLCLVGATIELEFHKRREAKKYQDWADKERRKK